MTKNITPRKGCKDIWNAYMCKNANFSISKNDIPYCPTTAKTLPDIIIPWDEAKHIYKKLIKGNKNFVYDAFVCFYLDDYKFDGIRGIWQDSKAALNILKHFCGVITPDFSTNQDFPDAIKRYNTYRMRVFGYWLGKNGIQVINNVRWGTRETWTYCWDGIPVNSVVAIGTVGGSPRKLIDKTRFEEGLYEMVRVLHPHTIIVYGSDKYPCFDVLRNKNITIKSYPSKTASSFQKREIMK